MQTLYKWIPSFIKWRLFALKPQKVGDQGLMPEILAIPFNATGSGRLCHFIYGEDTFFYTPWWRKPNNKLMATYHYPPNRLLTRVNPAVVAHLDAVVVVSTSQKPYFEQLLDSDHVHFIPHHVDAEFFSPSTQNEFAQGADRVVVVGGILRDHGLLEQVIERCQSDLDRQVHFDLVIPKTEHERFTRFSNCTVHSGISDEALRQLYRNARLGFMPLLDCTANNAILEMMACGTPLVTSDVGGIRDYLDEKGAVFYDLKDPLPRVIESIYSLLDDPESAVKKGAWNRFRVEREFAIPVIAERFDALYRLVAEGNSKEDGKD